MASALDILIRLSATGQNQVKGALEETADAAKKVDGSLSDVGENDGLTQAEAKAKKYWDAMDEASDKTENLTRSLEKVRNVAGMVALAGAGGIVLSKHLQEVAAEGEGVEARLESILRAQQRLGDLDGLNEKINSVAAEGHFDDDDELRNATVLLSSYGMTTEHINQLLPDVARQARTMGMSLDSVANGMGKAYGDGSLTMLRKAGLIFSDQEEAAVKAAYGISQAAGQMEFARVVAEATERNTVALGDSLTDAQAKANDAARSIDDVQTQMGKGAQNAQANLDTLGAKILSVVSYNPKLAEGAGAVLTYGSYAVTSIAGVVAFAAQVGSTVIQYQALALAKRNAAAAAGEDAAAETIEAGAVTASGVAADGAAISFGALAIAIGLVAIALVGLAVAYQGSKDASTMSDDELKDKWGGLGSWWVSASGSDRANPETGDDMSGVNPNDPTANGAADPAAQAKAAQDKALQAMQTPPVLPTAAAATVSPAATAVATSAPGASQSPKTVVSDSNADVGTLLRFGMDSDEKAAHDHASGASHDDNEAPSRVLVPFPKSKQRTLPDGRILLSFEKPADIVIDNPLRRKLEARR